MGSAPRAPLREQPLSAVYEAEHHLNRQEDTEFLSKNTASKNHDPVILAKADRT